jgi:hypothetical protein
MKTLVSQFKDEIQKMTEQVQTVLEQNRLLVEIIKGGVVW